jgi:DNA-binding NarL/FixJ family response regulator
MQKLKLENRTQIITYATRAQLLDDDELDAE